MAYETRKALIEKLEWLRGSYCDLLSDKLARECPGTNVR